MKPGQRREIEVWAAWAGTEPGRMGVLHVAATGGQELYSFAYAPSWLNTPNAQVLDPGLLLFEGPQYPSLDRTTFGLFMDSSPDRWGRTLMKRREAQESRDQKRPPRKLYESDFLLGVYDGHRMGGLRFKLDPDGPFLDDNKTFAAPPWTSLRELEFACSQIEADNRDDPHYRKWLQMLIAPGTSLGGARPKAGVVDPQGHLWIAKFPSQADDYDLGTWEYLVYQLARGAGIETAPAKKQKFNSRYNTFLTRRFDRTEAGERIHFASAMTLSGRSDGEDHSQGASYLEMAETLMRGGAQANRDLEQLWRRIVFSICISNVDDHLRNHGFLLTPTGWVLSPAYDMNPVPFGNGLKLNISEDDNAQDLDLARSVAKEFRVKDKQASTIIDEIVQSVRGWRQLANKLGISSSEQEDMGPAFRIADAQTP